MTTLDQLYQMKAELDGALEAIKRVCAIVEAIDKDLRPVDDTPWLLYPLPVAFPVTSGFWDAPIPQRPTIHEGVDFGCPIGVNVMAAAGGIVISGHFNSAYGYRVQLEHERGGETWFTWYCHLSTVRVVPGQAVIAGQSIGVSGDTGNVTGPHLHFNVQRERDKFLIAGLPEILRGCVDPMPWIKSPSAGWYAGR